MTKVQFMYVPILEFPMDMIEKNGRVTSKMMTLKEAMERFPNSFKQPSKANQPDMN